MTHRRLYPILTRDPLTGDELVVTRLEGPVSGVVIEGEFTLGWLARLTPEQLEFVEVLVRNRGNVQKVATEMAVAYNTARARLDDIVTALGGTPDLEPPAPAGPTRKQILEQLRTGEIDHDTAMRLLSDKRR